MATKKKPTPDELKAAQRQMIVNAHKQEFVQIMEQNIGNKFTPQVGTGIHADFCRLVDNLLLSLEQLNGNAN